MSVHACVLKDEKWAWVVLVSSIYQNKISISKNMGEWELRKECLQSNVEEYKKTGASKKSTLWNSFSFVWVKQRQIPNHSSSKEKYYRQIPQNDSWIRGILADNNTFPCYCSSSCWLQRSERTRRILRQ